MPRSPYELFAYSFLLTYLKFLISQNSSQGALIRSFQMALSLRDVSLTEGGELPHVFEPLSLIFGLETMM